MARLYIYNWLKFDLYLPCVHLAVETFGDNDSHQNPVTLTGSQRESSQDKPSSGSHSPSGLLLYANVFGRKPTKYGRGIKSWAGLRMTPLSLQSWSQPGWIGPQLPTTSLYLCSVPIFIVFLGNSHMGHGWIKRSLSNLSMKLPVSFFLITDNLLIDLTPSQFNFFLSHAPSHPSPQCPMTSKKNLSSKHSHYPAKIILTSPLEFI